ncbi:DUF2185 domain-containing protein [Paramicrobacterium agarici]|uniref:Immunity protein Imm33 domain-containing protein n=1 Tax=Paramicrobacterium agarici TaxID=630514 RepID=A0A2A9DWB0_9MICO|nr:DUF2185 domain-containing protein [Microbacterium agarici]PFG30199.1 hypothetical protein ATJ78_1123 [Microbacterium agarici]
MSKRYVLDSEELLDLATGYGTAVASDQITVAGRAVGYMYREEPSDDADSGWRFLSGDESQEYLDDERHVGVFDVNEIANLDDAIVEYLDAAPGTELVRIEGSDEFADDDAFGDESDDGWEEFDVDAVDSLDDLREDDRL